MPRIKPDLSVDERIKIIRGAQKLLGANGENWIKGYWFGKRLRLADGDGRRVASYLQVPPAEADCWCLLGALEESAYQLGLSERRAKARVLGAATSIKKLLRRKLVANKNTLYPTMPIDAYNDSSRTQWKDIKSLMAERIKELKKEME